MNATEVDCRAPVEARATRRSFLDVVVAAAGLDDQREALFVVPLDGTLLTCESVDLLGDDPGDGRRPGLRRGRTARDVASIGLGMRTVVVVRAADPSAVPAGEELSPWAVVDGWRALQVAGVNVDLRDADLRGADLAGARLSGADLSGANLERAVLSRAHLDGAVLHGANLRGADLRRTNLQGADLTEADLRRADLSQSDLRGARVTRSALRGAELFSAYVWDVDFSEAFTAGTQLDRADHRGSTPPSQ